MPIDVKMTEAFMVRIQNKIVQALPDYQQIFHLWVWLNAYRERWCMEAVYHPISKHIMLKSVRSSECGIFAPSSCRTFLLAMCSRPEKGLEHIDRVASGVTHWKIYLPTPVTHRSYNISLHPNCTSQTNPQSILSKAPVSLQFSRICSLWIVGRVEGVTAHPYLFA